MLYWFTFFILNIAVFQFGDPAANAYVYIGGVPAWFGTNLKVTTNHIFIYGSYHGFNMELDIQSLFVLRAQVYSFTRPLA